MTTKGKRHTKAREDLINEIIDRRINLGHSNLNLMDWIINEKKYSKPYAYELMNDARKEIDERSIINFGEDLKTDIERFEKLYSDAVEQSNTFLAKDILKEIAKLKGHFVERSVIEHKGQIDIIKITRVKKEE